MKEGHEKLQGTLYFLTNQCMQVLFCDMPTLFGEIEKQKD